MRAFRVSKVKTDSVAMEGVQSQIVECNACIKVQTAAPIIIIIALTVCEYSDVPYCVQVQLVLRVRRLTRGINMTNYQK